MKHPLKLYVYTSILTNRHDRESRKDTDLEFSGLRVDVKKKRQVLYQ